jgi:hypothetical protein
LIAGLALMRGRFGGGAGRQCCDSVFADEGNTETLQIIKCVRAELREAYKSKETVSQKQKARETGSVSDTTAKP